MTIRTQSRTNFPVRPLVFVGVLVAGIAIGFGAAKWDSRESGSSNEAAASTGFGTWIAPAPPTAYEAFQAEMALHEALTEAQFGPLMRVTVPVDIVMTELAQHDNAIEAMLASTGGGVTVASDNPATSVSAGDDTAAAAEAIAQHGNAFPFIP